MNDQQQTMARRESAGPLARPEERNAWADLAILKPFQTSTEPGPVRADALATISAGFKVPRKDGRGFFPKPSRDGRIFLTDPEGRAPALEALLAEDPSRLQIAVVSNNPREVLQQRYAGYTATRLEMYGDEHRMVVIEAVLDERNQPIKQQDGTIKTVRHEYLAGTSEYAEAKAACKANYSLYFCLARWNGNTPEMFFPDGLGLYRLRTTSHNSAENFRAALAYAASVNGGRVAGIPFTLRIVQREVSAPDGSRRKVPVWTMTLQPPQTLVLVPSSLREMLDQASDQAKMMLRPPTPSDETEEMLALEGPASDEWEEDAPTGLSENDFARLMSGGGLCNADYWRAAFFRVVADSPLHDDEGRAAFMSAFTGGKFSSLARYLAQASTADAMRLVHDAERVAGDQRTALAVAAQPGRGPLRTYEQLFGADDDAPQASSAGQQAAPPPDAPQDTDPPPPEDATPQPAPPAGTLSYDPPRPEAGQAYTRAVWNGFYSSWLMRFRYWDAASAREMPASPEPITSNERVKTLTLEMIGRCDDISEAIGAASADDDQEVADDIVFEPDEEEVDEETREAVAASPSIQPAELQDVPF